jgi:hypothetical protein
MSLSLHSQSVNVNRLKALEVLKTNRTKHIKAYNKALQDYRKAHIVDLQAALALAQDLKTPLNKLVIKFDAAPVSYESSYTEVIEMLEVSVDRTINLDNSAFRAYFKDEWNWKKSFEVANTMYATKAATFTASR